MFSVKQRDSVLGHKIRIKIFPSHLGPLFKDSFKIGIIKLRERCGARKPRNKADLRMRSGIKF